MKVNGFKKEIETLSPIALEKKLQLMRNELFSLKLNSAVSHLKDYSHFSKLRKNIARVLTVLHQKEVQSEQ